MNDYEKELIENEIKGCFDFFWNESNAEVDNPGYGLTLDKAGHTTCSIAAIGFALCAYMIGVEHKYITFEQGYDRVLGTFKTLENIKKNHGFFPHFVNYKNGENRRSEYSTIDTALLLIGGIPAAEYFGGEIKDIVYKMINDLDWNYFIQERNGKKQICMAYSDYVWQDNNGFCPATWDQYAEHIMMYFLIAGRDDYSKELSLDLFNGFVRHQDKYRQYEVVHCYANALFIHQFTHAFFPFQNYLDCNGFDWFQNSINATLANRAYCLSLKKKFKTYDKNSWGLTAFQGEHGYRVFGGKPFGLPYAKYSQKVDGSVAPYASLCSINFTPKQSLECLKYFQTIPGLIGKYGINDSYNLDTGFVSSDALGIDKGPTIVHLDNFLNKTTWTYFMKSDFIKKAINKLDFKEREN